MLQSRSDYDKARKEKKEKKKEKKQKKQKEKKEKRDRQGPGALGDEEREFIESLAAKNKKQRKANSFLAALTNSHQCGRYRKDPRQ